MDNREDVGEYYPGGSVVSAKPEPAAHPVESVNGKAGAVVLTAADVGALPDTTEIPDAEKVSAWGFLKKTWSDLVAAFAAKVHRHTIGQVDGLQSELSTLDQKATEASDLAASAQGTADSAAQQVSGAYAAASAAELKAGNAYTTAMVADSKATNADSKATAADSKATAAKSIAEDAQVSADDAVAYAELAVRTAESKLDSDGKAADSAKLGGVEADKYALKTALATKITNYGHSQEIRFADAPDGGNVVFSFSDGPITRVLIASVGDGESIEFDWIEGGEGKVLYVKDIATKDAVATAQQTAEAATLLAGNAYTTAMAADSKATNADSKATAAKSIAEDAQVSADDAVATAELAVRTAESIVPSRLKNDADTVRCDGEGNVYALEVPKSMYFIVDKGWGGGTDLQEWTLYSSGNGVWKWSNNGAYSSNSYYITYDASAGTLSAYYASGGYSRTITVEKNLDPTAEGVDFGGLGGLTVAQYSCSYIPKTNQRSEPSEPTDRFAKASELDNKLDKSGGSLSGPLTIGSVTITDTGVEINGKKASWSKSGEVAMADDLAYSLNMAGTILNRAMNYIVADGTALALRPPSAIEGKIRDFVLRIDCTETTTIDWSAFGNCETTGGKSWSDMMLVESGKSYVYRFTDMGGDHLCAAREEIS